MSVPNVTFQAFSWFSNDGQTYDGQPETSLSLVDLENGACTIHVFGKTCDGKTVAACIENYHPSITLHIRDKKMDSRHYDMICDWMESKLFVKNDNSEGEDERKWVSVSDQLVPAVKYLTHDKILWGFTNGRQFPFYEFRFKTEWAYRKILNQLKYHRNKVESDCPWFGSYQLFNVIDPMIRWTHEQNLQMAGWIEIPRKHCRKSTFRRTSCDIEFTVDYQHVKSIQREEICGELTEMSFDIEVDSWDGLFPNPRDPRNPAFQIGVTLKKYKDKSIQERILIHYGPACAKVPNTTVKRVNTERELLIAFRNLIIEKDPDIIYAYNGDKFDWQYLYERASINACLNEFLQMSRLKGYLCPYKESSFSSSAYGDNDYKRILIPGRLNLDLLIFIQRGVEKYERYNLDTIAEIQLGEKKKPVSAKMIFQYYKSGDADKCAIIGDYCIQDTALVQLLVDKMDVVTQLFEMSNITYTQVTDLLVRGQQVKAYSLILKMAYQKGFRVPYLDEREGGKSKGATVLDPITGLYKHPVCVLDFASLYPTIMMAYNMCYSTLVFDSKYDNIEGIQYDTVAWTDDDGRQQKWRIAQNCDSVIPELQRSLFASRKKVKGMIKELVEWVWDQDKGKKIPKYRDQLRYRVLSGRELAIKVTMNSIYGFTSAFMLCMKALTGCVTAQGRHLIDQTKHFMEDEFPDICVKQGWTTRKMSLKVIAGDTDSVFVHFPDCSIMEAMQLSQKAEVILTQKVFNRPPIQMEYEKTYCPFILEKKKRYIGKKFAQDDISWSIDFKGIALKRRNYCHFVKNMYMAAVNQVLHDVESGPKKAIDEVAKMLEDLKLDKIPLEDLSVTASLKAHYTNERLPHVKLAERMKERDPGSAPQIGDRFPFVIIEDFTNGEELFARSEDLYYAKENQLSPDKVYYLNQQVRNPLTEFFKIIGEEHALNAAFQKYDEYFRWKQDAAKQAGFRHRNNLRDITSFFSASPSSSSTSANDQTPPLRFRQTKRQTRQTKEPTKIRITDFLQRK